MKRLPLLKSVLASLLFLMGQGNPLPALAQDSRPVSVLVKLEDSPLYKCTAADSATATAEAGRIRQLLEQMQAAALQPDKLRLYEENSNGVLLLDSSKVIVVTPENRIRTDISPLANALIIRDWLVLHATKPPWNEEELLLRLLLGIVFPFSLIVILRLTRLGIRKWERNWRMAALHWFVEQAEQRGVPSSGGYGRQIVHILLGLERLLFFSGTVVLVSFGWFTLFPQTRPLAASLIERIVGPAFSLLGDTIHALLLLSFIITILALARWVDHQLTQHRKMPGVLKFFQDSLINIPIRLSVWIMALFLILFPFPGAPRMFAVGLLFITLVTSFLALRPIIEEISAGIWISRHFHLKPGDVFLLGNQEYTLISFHLIHLIAECDKQRRFVPYSKIIKSEFSMPREAE